MKECSLGALAFEYDHPEDFREIVCQKRNGPSIILIIFRVFAELYTITIGIWLATVIFMTPEQKFYISYITWVQILWSASAEYALATSFRNTRKSIPEDTQAGLLWYTKVYWALFSATLPAVVVSFIVFWSQIPHENVDILYIFMGNVTPFLSLIEFALVAFPLRIINFFYFLLHSFLYIILSAVYQELGGRGMYDTPWIYKDLDWRDPKHAVLACFVALLVGEAAYVIFWAFSKLKFSKWCCRKETTN